MLVPAKGGIAAHHGYNFIEYLCLGHDGSFRMAAKASVMQPHAEVMVIYSIT